MTEKNGKRPKATRKEVESILKQAEGQGARVELRRGGHWAIFSSDPTVPPVFIPATASDHRSLKNAKGELRRRGFTIT